jgi:hypothetical protein
LRKEEIFPQKAYFYFQMRTGLTRHEFLENWVEGVARHINDPVQRLRFVRVASPSRVLAPPIPKPMRAVLFPKAIALLLFLLLASATAYLAYHENYGRRPRSGQTAVRVRKD